MLFYTKSIALRFAIFKNNIISLTTALEREYEWVFVWHILLVFGKNVLLLLLHAACMHACRWTLSKNKLSIFGFMTVEMFFFIIVLWSINNCRFVVLQRTRVWHFFKWILYTLVFKKKDKLMIHLISFRDFKTLEKIYKNKFIKWN